MTRSLDHPSVPASLPPRGLPMPLQVRWTCSAMACAPLLELDPSLVSCHARASVTLAAERLDDEHVTLEAWIDHEDRRTPLLRGATVRATVRRERTWLHVDIDDAEHACVAMTIDLHTTSGESGRLLYIRTDLLTRAGLRGGRYDRPELRLAPPRQNAASA